MWIFRTKACAEDPGQWAAEHKAGGEWFGILPQDHCVSVDVGDMQQSIGLDTTAHV